jgi:hypothetical protein
LKIGKLFLIIINKIDDNYLFLSYASRWKKFSKNTIYQGIGKERKASERSKE